MKWQVIEQAGGGAVVAEDLFNADAFAVGAAGEASLGRTQRRMPAIFASNETDQPAVDNGVTSQRD